VNNNVLLDYLATYLLTALSSAVVIISLDMSYGCSAQSTHKRKIGLTFCCFSNSASCWNSNICVLLW